MDLLARTLKRRHGGEHGKGHGHHRHHRKQRGVGQGCRIVGTAISEKALQQETPEFHPVVEALTHALSLAVGELPLLQTSKTLRCVQTLASTRLE
ncbi:hypothetical protein D3C84_1107400 [compost metagenome]